MPKVSVIMPVYNAEKYLREAIDSILNQTFRDFEFIIIDDGSGDSSVDIVRNYDDRRIHFYQNEQNMGVAATLNKGIDLANGEYIARMDADDISISNRLNKQVSFMDKHSDVAVLGTGIELFGIQWGKRTYSTVYAQLKVDLLFSCCFAHPSVMMRSSIIGKNGYHYDTSFSKMEDYDLWCRVSENYVLASIPDILLKYRVHAEQVTQSITTENEKQHCRLRKRLMEQLNVDVNDLGFEQYMAFCLGKLEISLSNICILNEFFGVIKAKNKLRKRYNQKCLDRTLKLVIKGMLDKLSGREVVKLVFKSGLNVIAYAIERGMKSVITRGGKCNFGK